MKNERSGEERNSKLIFAFCTCLNRESCDLVLDMSQTENLELDF